MSYHRELMCDAASLLSDVLAEEGGVTITAHATPPRKYDAIIGSLRSTPERETFGSFDQDQESQFRTIVVFFGKHPFDPATDGMRVECAGESDWRVNDILNQNEHSASIEIARTEIRRRYATGALR